MSHKLHAAFTSASIPEQVVGYRSTIPAKTDHPNIEWLWQPLILLHIFLIFMSFYFHWISSSKMWRRKCPSHLIVVQITKQNQKMALYSVVPSKQMGFPAGSVVKNPPANAGELSSIPWSGRSPGEGNGNPLQYSYLGNPTDQGAWQATVHGAVKELDTTEWLNNTE